MGGVVLSLLHNKKSRTALRRAIKKMIPFTIENLSLLVKVTHAVGCYKNPAACFFFLL